MPAAFHGGTVEATEVAAVASTRLGPERLRSFQVIPTDMPPSPPDSSGGMELLPDPLTVVDMEDEDGEDDVKEDEDYAEGGEDEEEEADENTEFVTPVIGPNRTNKLVAEEYDEIDTRAEEEHRAFSASTEEATEQDARARDTPPPAHGVTSTGATQNTTDSNSPADDPSDPYAAIQARIRARRSIGSTPSLPKAVSPLKPTSSSRATNNLAPSHRPTSTSRSVSSSRSLSATRHQKQNQSFI